MFRVNIKEVFDRVVVNDDNCEGCQYKGRYSGEDGQPEWNCIGNKFDCPQVDAKKAELEDFMADHHADFELIEEVK